MWWNSQSSSAFGPLENESREQSISITASRIYAPLDSQTWSQIASESDDTATAEILSSWAETFRTEGFPVSAIRAVLQAKLDFDYREKEDALRADHLSKRYWNAEFRRNSISFKTSRDHARLEQEKSSILRKVLGNDAETALERHLRIRKYGPLSHEKVDQLELIAAEYTELIRDSRDSRLSPFSLPADKETSEIIHAEHNHAIAAALSPAELREYQTRNDAISKDLRTHLRDFNPTEEEFRTLYSFERDAADQIVTYESGSTSALEAKIATFLGPERFAEYTLKTSDAFNNAATFVARAHLPSETATFLARLELDALETSKLHRENPDTTSNDRDAQLTALQTQIHRQLAETLEPAQLEAYLKNRASRWIKSLAPLPTATPVAPSGGG